MNSPTPDQVREHRGGRTREDYGALVGVKSVTVRSWELGTRAMPPGLWLLVRARIADKSPNEIA